MAVTTAISDLTHSIYEIFASVFNTIYAIIHGAFSAVGNILSSIFHLIGNVFHQVAAFAGGVTNFVLGNFVILAVGAVLAIGFVRYTSQGKKMTNKKTQ